MRIFWFLFVAVCLVSFSACQTETDSANNVANIYQVHKSKVERDYFRYGETIPFMNEYGEVILSTNLDSTLLEYCKDSSVTFRQSSEQYTKSNKKICYPTKVMFVNNKMLINNGVEPAGKFFSRSQIKEIYPFKINDEPFTVLRLFTIISEDREGSKILMHTNEYWSEKLGMILKMDENFMNKRRRIIKTKNVTNTKGELMEMTPFINRIYQDSSSWITRRKDGTAWF